MVPKVELFPKGNPKALMAVTTDEKTVFLLYRRLSQYNRDLTPIATERLNATVCNGLIVGTVTAYKEQTGLVFAWDPVKNRILHVSDGKFAIQALLVKDKVYFLQCISYYGKYPEFRLGRMDLGNKDMQKDYEFLSLPDEVINHMWPEGADVSMKYQGGRIIIRMGNEEFSINIPDERTSDEKHGISGETDG